MEELLRRLNEASEFSRAIAAIEAIPEAERSYSLTLWLGRLYGNLAVLGDHDENREKEPDQGLIQKSIAILETIREEGEKDALWNSRMALVLQMAEGRMPEALARARRWQELDPKDPDAGQMVKFCREYLWRTEKKGKKY